MLFLNLLSFEMHVSSVRAEGRVVSSVPASGGCWSRPCSGSAPMELPGTNKDHKCYLFMNQGSAPFKQTIGDGSCFLDHTLLFFSPKSIQLL